MFACFTCLGLSSNFAKIGQYLNAYFFNEEKNCVMMGSTICKTTFERNRGFSNDPSVQVAWWLFWNSILLSEIGTHMHFQILVLKKRASRNFQVYLYL